MTAGGGRGQPIYVAVLAALLLGVAASSSTGAPRPIGFAIPQTYAVGTTPVDPVVADFNGDGAADLAVANHGSGDVSILLNRGDGTLTGANTYAARGSDGSSPSYVATGDFNEDGKLDLATDGAILIGHGDGSFDPPKPFGAGSSVAVGDLNADGYDDLVVTSSDLSIRLGNGDGSFKDPVSYDAGAGPSSVAIADLNEDNKPDIAVTAGGGHAASVLLGNGDGTVQAKQDVPLGDGADPAAISIGDVNGDGHADLAVASYYASDVSILVGDGTGKFAEPSHIGIGGHAADVRLADLNADGALDLLVSRLEDDKLVTFAGNGDGTFGSATGIAVPPGPDGLALGDLNRDGRPGDVAVAAAGGNEVTVLANIAVEEKPGDVGTDVDASITVEAGGPVRFPSVSIGDTAGPISAPVRVISNDAAGYRLMVSRTEFSGGDIPLSVQSGPVPSGMTLDLTGLTPIPTSGGQIIGHRDASISSESGDLWPTGLVLGPVRWTSAGTHKATVVYTAVGF